MRDNKRRRRHTIILAGLTISAILALVFEAHAMSHGVSILVNALWLWEE